MAPTPVMEAPERRDKFDRLRPVKLGEVRRSFSEETYRRSPAKTFGFLAVDLVVYAAFVAGALLAPHPLLQIASGVLAGFAVASLFVWAHDAAHGALFRSEGVAEVFGTIAMLPSFNLYRLWVYGHNKVHHGYTSYSPIDWIWKPDTRAEYAARSSFSKIVYRIERSLPGCALHYVLRVWWPGMITFRPGAEVRKRYHFTRSKIATASFAVVMIAVAALVGGWVGVLSAVVIPWVVFNYHIALYVYLHHTHPTLPFFDDRKDWSATIGQIGCSVVIRGSRLFEWVSHYILVHTPHHVDARIPFYRLPQGWRDLQPTYGQDVLSYRFRWRTVESIFRQCKVFDFDTNTWYRFSDLRS